MTFAGAFQQQIPNASMPRDRIQAPLDSGSGVHPSALDNETRSVARQTPWTRITDRVHIAASVQRTAPIAAR
jgi:hypothetical protein